MPAKPAVNYAAPAVMALNDAKLQTEVKKKEQGNIEEVLSTAIKIEVYEQYVLLQSGSEFAETDEGCLKKHARGVNAAADSSDADVVAALRRQMDSLQQVIRKYGLSYYRYYVVRGSSTAPLDAASCAEQTMDAAPLPSKL